VPTKKVITELKPLALTISSGQRIGTIKSEAAIKEKVATGEISWDIEQETPNPSDLIAWCKDRIAYFKTPRYVEFVSSFPRTMTKNEIARHELRELGIGTAWDATIGEWTSEHSNS
jgi:acyl-CoA synthetase (AMP-forming)/AMP-acid ligase II